MREFVLKIISFILIETIMLTSLGFYKTHNNRYVTKVAGSEVYWSIFKSQKRKQVRKLLIGDSVCKQLYDNYEYNDSIYSLGCNQAITVAGHYFLLNNFLQANKNQLPKEVIMLYSPFSFKNNIDKYAFNYFLKPFYNTGYKNLMDDYLLSRIEKIPFYYASQFSYIKASNISPNYHLETGEYGIFSPLSKIYLEKIVQLCEEKNIAFRLEPVPIKKSNRDEIETLIKQREINVPDINPDILKEYFNKITYFDDTLFIDRSHFKQECIPFDYLKLTKCNIDSLGILK